MPRWTKAEDAKLVSWLYYHPTREVTRLFLEWQAANPDRDGHDRTEQQVYQRASKIRHAVPKIDRFSLRQWGQQLGIPRGRLVAAIGKLPEAERPRPASPRDFALSTEQLWLLLKRYPYVLNGGDIDRARAHFGDRVDALDIHSPNHVPVRNRDTGEIFPSTRDAGRANFIAAEAISRSIRIGGTAAGYRWERVSRSAIAQQKAPRGVPGGHCVLTET